MTGAVQVASNLFGIPVNRFGNFDTEQAKYVHILRMKINELQQGFRDGEVFYDKMGFKEIMLKARIHAPKTYSYIKNSNDFPHFWDSIKDVTEFVYKPNHLSQGRHIHVIKVINGEYIEMDGTIRTKEFFEKLSIEILSGHHIYKGLILEERIRSHPQLQEWYGNEGIADLRAYVLGDRYLFGKLRLPSKLSHGFANTARSATACYVDENGIIQDGSPFMDNVSAIHPDTKKNLTGIQIPHWNKFFGTIVQVSKLFKIPFHSVDLTVNQDGIPTVIESEKIPYLTHFTKRGAIELTEKVDNFMRSRT